MVWTVDTVFTMMELLGWKVVARGNTNVFVHNGREEISAPSKSAKTPVMDIAAHFLDIHNQVTKQNVVMADVVELLAMQRQEELKKIGKYDKPGYRREIYTLIRKGDVGVWTIEDVQNATGFSHRTCVAALADLALEQLILRIKPGVYVANFSAPEKYPNRSGKKKWIAEHQHLEVKEVKVVTPEEVEDATWSSAGDNVIQLQMVDVADYAEKVSAEINHIDPYSVDEVYLDDLFNCILDTVFPQGFKAKHLPAIQRWKESTLTAIREIGLQ